MIPFVLLLALLHGLSLADIAFEKAISPAMRREMVAAAVAREAAEKAMKAEHERRVALSRATIKLQQAIAQLQRVNLAVQKAEKDLAWVRKNRTYTEVEKVKKKCAACGGSGKIAMPDGHGRTRAAPHHQCGGKGFSIVSKTVTKVRDPAPYEKQLKELLTLQENATKEHEALLTEVQALKAVQ